MIPRNIGIMVGAVIALGGGLGGVAMVESAAPVAKAISEPAAPSQQQQKQQAMAQATRREVEHEQRMQRWRGWRYRKDGQPRKAGDRAHKRMKQRRRGGV